MQIIEVVEKFRILKLVTALYLVQFVKRVFVLLVKVLHTNQQSPANFR